jgi:hypothetical protein
MHAHADHALALPVTRDREERQRNGVKNEKVWIQKGRERRRDSQKSDLKIERLRGQTG